MDVRVVCRTCKAEKDAGKESGTHSPIQRVEKVPDAKGNFPLLVTSPVRFTLSDGESKKTCWSSPTANSTADPHHQYRSKRQSPQYAPVLIALSSLPTEETRSSAVLERRSFWILLAVIRAVGRVAGSFRQHCTMISHRGSGID